MKSRTKEQENKTCLSVKFPIDTHGAIAQLQGNEKMFYNMLEWFDLATIDKNML